MPFWFMEQWQIYRFNRAAKIAKESVGMYKDIFAKAGVGPARISGLRDLERFPVITKTIIKSYKGYSWDGMVADSDAADLSRRARAVSVCREDGKPFLFWVDLESEPLGRFPEYVRRLGFNLSGGRTIVFSATPKPILLNRNLLFFPRRYPIDKEEEFVLEMRDFDPQYIFFDTYSRLFQCAEIFRKRGLTNKIKPKSIFVFIPYLSQKDRHALQEIFCCTIFLVIYAPWHEAPFLGWECGTHLGFHLNRQSYLLEVVDEKGKQLPTGKEGKIVVTNFDNEVMPFLRYDTGDRGEFLEESCSCGIASPLFLINNNQQYFFSGNRLIDYGDLGYIFRYYHGSANEFRVKASAPNTITVEVLPQSTWIPDYERHLRAALEMELGRAVNVDIRIGPPKST